MEEAKRGRPIGSVNRSAKFTHYNPKRWQPEFDLIVIESIAGKSNEEIGRLFGYTKEHVSNILSTAKAQEIKERIRESINKGVAFNIQERLAAIGEKAIERMEAFIDNDNAADASPFKFIDRVVKIAQTVNVGGASPGNGNTTIVNGNAIVLNSTHTSNLKDALAKSMELDNVNVGDIVENRDIISQGEIRRIG